MSDIRVILRFLGELLAARIAAEAARLAAERVKETFAVSEFDPDEVHGFMTSEEVAGFLGLPYSSFREIAPSWPRATGTRTILCRWRPNAGLSPSWRSSFPIPKSRGRPVSRILL